MERNFKCIASDTFKGFYFKILSVVRIRWVNCFYQSISIVCCWNSCSKGRGTKVVRCVTTHIWGKLVALCLLHWLGGFADSTCCISLLTPDCPCTAGPHWLAVYELISLMFIDWKSLNILFVWSLFEQYKSLFGRQFEFPLKRLVCLW